jgi:methionine-rich copper-binding protein CopC
MKKIVQLFGICSVIFNINSNFAQQKEITQTNLGTSGVTFAAIMDPSTITMTLTGPSDRWFGVGFGTAMANADVLIHTTGHSTAPHVEAARDYVLTAHGAAGVTLDLQDDWTIIGNSIVGSTRTIIAFRDLNTGDAQDHAIVFNDATLDVIFAKSSSASMQLAYHGNGVGSNRGTQNLTWSVVDVTAPLLVSTTPIDNATNVSLTNNLTAVFSEVVLGTIGTVELRLSSDNSLVESIGFSSSQLIFAGPNLQINPVADLLPNTGYYVNISSGGIQDPAGNVFTGITGSTLWNFTTGTAADVTPPVLSVTPFSPADNSINVALNPTFTATFSEPITLGIGTFALINTTTSGVVQTFGGAAISASGSTVTFTLASALLNNTAYHIAIATGAVNDLAGNAFVGFSNPTTWNFTTLVAADVSAPILTASPFSPADNAVNVVTSSILTVTFNESIVLSTGAISLFNGASSALVQNFSGASAVVSGATLTLTPSSALQANTLYYVTIANNAIMDLAGNNYAGFTNNATWNFTTASNVGLEENTPVNFSYSNQLLLISPKTSLESTVKILDMSGKVIFESSKGNEILQISTSTFANQMVVLMIETQGNIWTKKISL